MAGQLVSLRRPGLFCPPLATSKTPHPRHGDPDNSPPAISAQNASGSAQTCLRLFGKIQVLATTGTAPSTHNPSECALHSWRRQRMRLTEALRLRACTHECCLGEVGKNHEWMCQTSEYERGRTNASSARRLHSWRREGLPEIRRAEALRMRAGTHTRCFGH